MKKYRIRLKNGRVVGPFFPPQIKELFQKKHIDGTEKCQVFPGGDWLDISYHKEINLKDTDATEVVEEATFIRKLSDLNAPQTPVAADNKDSNKALEEAHPDEFRFDEHNKEITKPTAIIESPPKSTKKNTKTKQSQKAEKVIPKKVKEAVKEEVKEVKAQKAHKEEAPKLELPEKELELEDNLDKTIVNKLVPEKSLSEENIDKTIINKSTLDYLELEKQKKEQEEQQKLIEKSEEENQINYEEEATQQLNLTEIKNELIKKAELHEEEFEEALDGTDGLEKFYKNNPKRINEEDIESKSNKKKKKRSKIIRILAVLVIIWMVLDEEESTKKTSSIETLKPKIMFPVQYDKPSKDKSELLYGKGVDLYRNSDFESKLKASVLFKQAVENQFDNNRAFGMLLLSYSEILESSFDIGKDSEVIFNLVKIGKNRILEDVNISLGIAKFYYVMEKYNAAISVIENYTRIKSPSLKMFSIYLESLIKSGDLSKARKVYEKIKTAPQKIPEGYIATVKFDFLNDNYTEAELTIEEALNKYQSNIEIYLLKCQLLVYKEDFSSLTSVLENLKDLNVFSSRIHYSKYLEFAGLLFVSQGKHKEATSLFKKALKLNDSSSLRSKLATLSTLDNEKSDVSQLILESKSIDFINKAKSAEKVSNYELAMNYAINAVDIAPNSSKAIIYLASLQTKQGFFSQAIKALEELLKKSSLDPEANFALLEAYSSSFKVSKANNHFTMISNTSLKTHRNYASAVAKMYYNLIMGKAYAHASDYLQSVNWFNKAIKTNPLNEENYYYLAMLYIKFRKFDKAKSLISIAKELDPMKSEYRVAYSSILYEMEDVNTALGYLQDIASKFPDDPQVQGQIAIYYFRSGQLTAFEQQKSKVEGLPNKTPELYNFLITAAIMDEKFDLVLEYGKKLLAINPGDLKTRMLIGKILLEKEKYTEAMKMFKTVQDRLPSYPKLLYYISKIYLLIGEKDKAIEMAEKEKKNNPNLEEPYILVGDIYRDMNEYIKAEKNYKDAQRKNPKSIGALMGLAYIASKRNKYEVALDLYKKAVNENPSDSDLHKLLGDTYRNLGQGKLAIESYKVFLELSPETKYRKEIENYIRLLQ
jgi:tetratricopeptide (TPR) repeat protein